MEQRYFEEIYREYYRPLFLYAMSLCKNPQDAEDLVQGTFLKAFLSYQSGGSLKYWLVTVLKNEYFKLWKKRKRLVEEGQVSIENLKSEEEVLKRLILREEKRELYKAIEKLPRLQKQVILDTVYFQLKDEEIAESNGISREYVRQLRSRAKKRLLELIKEEGK